MFNKVEHSNRRIFLEKILLDENINNFFETENKYFERYKEIKDNYLYFYDCAKKEYGNERVSLGFINRYIDPCIIIYYPEIEIRNKNNIHHTIYDLYVFLSLEYNKISIYGLRVKYTICELACKYNHSHLPWDNDFTEGRFCLGQTNFNYITYNEKSIRLFLKNLNSYLAYESLEGGPYKKISNIIGKQEKYTELLPNTIEMIKDINFIDIKEYEFNLYLKNGRVCIHEDEIFEQALIREFPKYIIYRNENGNYYVRGKHELENIEKTIDKNKYFIFNKRKIHLTIFKEDIEKNEHDVKIVHPIIKQIVKNHIESKLNETARRYFKSKIINQ